MKGDELKKKKKEEEDQGEDEEENEDEEKSLDLSEDDLEKSLQNLEDEAFDGDDISRKDVLLEKAKIGTLEKSEQDELYQLLGGESREEEILSENIVKGLEENEDLQKALDVSDYLREQHDELCKSLESLADEIEKGGNRQHQFNLVLAKAVAETGRMVKGMAERIDVVEREPARAPKAMRNLTQPIEKGFAGQSPANSDELNKSQILDTLELMIEESVQKGNAGNTADGIDLTVVASKVEQFGQIQPTLLAKVKAFRTRGGATVQ